MSLNDERFFPYPHNPVTRFGFIVGDLIALSVILLILIPVAMTFVR
jgi:hypothetical protein